MTTEIIQIQEEGWIKLHRILLRKRIWNETTPNQKAVLITILLKASHSENEWTWNGIKHRTLPGQFKSSYQKIADQAGVHKEVVRKALDTFDKKYHFSTYQRTHQGILVTVANWDFYQGSSKDSTPQRTHPGHTQDTYQELDNKISVYIWLDDNKKLKEAWGLWKYYRKEQHKFKYKPTGERQALMGLYKKSDGSPAAAIEIIHESIENGWKGLFKPKKPTGKLKIQKKDIDEIDWSKDAGSII